ncbi:hypothetical protein OK074_2953 [Actinobacteria bacterium OK074]|nr:hypothetical protein OK074_2953 [Actinobacteria bacterium OK074]
MPDVLDTAHRGMTPVRGVMIENTGGGTCPARELTDGVRESGMSATVSLTHASGLERLGEQQGAVLLAQPDRQLAAVPVDVDLAEELVAARG